MQLKAKEAKYRKDTLEIGIYITSIHDIDFKSQDFEIDFWLWVNKINKKNYFISLLNTIEIPNSKEKEIQFIDSTTLSEQGIVSAKFSCKMKNQWKIQNFPFDHQKLILTIESSYLSSDKMEIIVTDANKNLFFNKDLKDTIILGWKIEEINLKHGLAKYYTNFGDTSIKYNNKEKSNIVTYSTAIIEMNIHRKQLQLFLKIFLCMYISFFIALVSFFIHYESIDSRVSLCVGALFAVIGNKYISESSLPESISFTLVDILHTITMFFILLMITANTLLMKYVKNGNYQIAIKLNAIIWKSLLVFYTLINFYFIYSALPSN
jgi:hypothetical protein